MLAPTVFSTAWAFVDHQVIPPGASAGPYQHEKIEEVYFVMEGMGQVQIGSQQAAIRQGDAFPVLLNEMCSLTNSRDADLELLVIGVALDKEE